MDEILGTRRSSLVPERQGCHGPVHSAWRCPASSVCGHLAFPRSPSDRPRSTWLSGL